MLVSHSSVSFAMSPTSQSVSVSLAAMAGDMKPGQAIKAARGYASRSASF